MTDEDQLIQNYTKKRLELEQEEDSLIAANHSGEQMIHETFDFIQRFAYDSSTSSEYEVIDRAKTELSRLEYEYNEKIEAEKKQVRQRQDDADREYKSAWRQ